MLQGDEGGAVGDGFLEEPARRRKAARLAERERLRSEKRGGGAKRFSLGGAHDADDETWVDIVVPSMGGGSVSGRGSRVKDPGEALQEVARVLNAVRGGQPYAMDDDSDMEGTPAAASVGAYGDITASSDYSNDTEVQEGQYPSRQATTVILTKSIGTVTTRMELISMMRKKIKRREKNQLYQNVVWGNLIFTPNDDLHHRHRRKLSTTRGIRRWEPLDQSSRKIHMEQMRMRTPRARCENSSDDEHNEPEEGSAERSRDHTDTLKANEPASPHSIT
ncbi:hypothetical protein D9757_010867 [Collybiopsis confluens]|uniref:Uncharacterized protein n=1 Tax=Collybiopsis confluens TaxID=2823264 RepID=A0A8H5H8H8_9AGAR|nr:hypothetical protein D9757_010867 [Collybiopsis confluens]